MKASQKKIYEKRIAGFSLAEALITLLIICVIAIASAPVITKKHRAKMNVPHGAFACYWKDNQLVSKYVINGVVSDGKVIYDTEEGRDGCEFNPPSNAKNFVATIVGGGGGGSGSATIQTDSQVIQNYGTAGDYIYKTPQSGLYTMLVVGGGGGGGGMFGSEPNRLAGIGSNGGLVYVPNVFIGKGVSLNVRVGKGGNGSWDGEGVSGTESYVKNVSDDITYAFAGGGAGGPGWHLWFTKSGDGNDENYVSGCTSSGEHVIWGLLQGIGARKVRINKSDRSEGPGYPRVFTQVYACDGGTASSDIASAVVIKGKKVSGSLGSSSHQNRWYPYNLVSSLTNYNGIFDMNYNILSKRSTKWCNSSSTWKTARNCQIYSNNFGAGGAAEGDYDEEYFEPISGGSGLAAIKYKPLFAGLGGEAGKVVQIPYAEMPQKTLLLPGKGGNGGKGSNITYHNTANTPGGNGQSSYIKNGTQIYGGKGASGINPADDSTYSSKFNDDQMPVGGDGLLADVLTNKKVGTGGLGGFSGNNNTMNGLTETIFEDGALVSSFNKIFGAGSGGGGASAAADSTGSVQLGDGGNGASGLVFIQW